MAHAETEHKSHFKLYMIVFVALALLTLIEVIIPEMDNLSQFFKASSLTGLAVGKAFLVGYFYMHLNEETKWLKFIALVPASAAIYATVVVLESLYR
jgi:cytochrome c oxidase subunit IV